jgi:hypothetical protein
MPKTRTEAAAEPPAQVRIDESAVKPCLHKFRRYSTELTGLPKRLVLIVFSRRVDKRA